MSYIVYKKPFTATHGPSYDNKLYASSVDSSKQGRVFTPHDSDGTVASINGFGVKHIVKGNVPVYEVLEALPGWYMKKFAALPTGSAVTLASGSFSISTDSDRHVNPVGSDGNIRVTTSTAYSSGITVGSFVYFQAGPAGNLEQFDLGGYVTELTSPTVLSIAPTSGDWSQAKTGAGSLLFYNVGYDQNGVPQQFRGHYINAPGGISDGYPTPTAFANAPAGKFGL